MTTESKPKEIVIAGDIALDWHIVNLPESQKMPVWNEAIPARIGWRFGGCLLLADLVAEMIQMRAAQGETWRLHRAQVPAERITPDDGGFIRSYTSWEMFPVSSAPEDARKPKVWRVKEFLGVTQTREEPASLASDPPEPDIIVLDDANLGFRGSRKQWPQAITAPQAGKRPWIVVKMAKPLVQGELWNELYEHWADRLVVILSIKDLRLSEVQISSELSWERTAQDVAWELVYNPRVNAISRAARVIVSFNAAGAIQLERAQAQAAARGDPLVPPKATLYFDPQAIEGAWEQARPGKMVGYNTCLAASVIRELMLNPQEPDFGRGIRSGLAALRSLHAEGYETPSGSGTGQLAFPYAKIARGIEESKGDPFASVEVQFPTRLLEQPALPPEQRPLAPGFWTILQQTCPTDLDTLAEKILLQGAEKALSNVPLGKFGNLLTVDRREIESFRGIRRLVDEYCSQESPKRPLSIAVFGPPGAGKSFGITQVAKSLRPGEIEDKTFNLSQFRSLEELAGALHQVRDLNLSGKIPLVFWDEFDSVFDGEEFGWLRYFLVPMQDGKFMENQVLHPLGKAVFVFAGGICHSLEDFIREARNKRQAKGPDFISRLRGFVNIMGANPPDTFKDKAIADPFYLVRRAILLRSILWQNAPHIFRNHESRGALQIDGSVLRALLKTHEYKHGARSMEAIINMSNLAGKNHFDQSSLPSEAQLDLHVDGQDFLGWIQQIVLEGETLERLASINHELFCEDLQRRGFAYGPKRDKAAKTHPLLVPYAELAEFYKESNRNAVRSIAEKLKAVGYIMIQARSNEPAFEFPGKDMEFLAEMEHDRYLQEELAQGWRYGTAYDETSRTNPTLLPWKTMSEDELWRRYADLAESMGRDELCDEEKEKDRNQIRGYPEVLRRAGYAIVKIRQAVL